MFLQNRKYHRPFNVEKAMGRHKEKPSDVGELLLSTAKSLPVKVTTIEKPLHCVKEEFPVKEGPSAEERGREEPLSSVGEQVLSAGKSLPVKVTTDNILLHSTKEKFPSNEAPIEDIIPLTPEVIKVIRN